jgi:hypothetical protein
VKKRLYVIVALAMAAALLAACGGGGGGTSKPPVDMQKYETDTFAVEYPSAWQKSGVDLMGLSMAFFSTKEIKVEDLGGLDFESMVSQDPVAVLMFVPQTLAGQMGMDDLDAAMSSTGIAEEDLEIIKEGDVTLDGAQGKILIAKGTDPKIGKMAAHVVMVKKSDGTVVVFMGATPEKDLDKNLEVFQYMQDAFKFK